MRILVTNDDGVAAEGLAVAEAIAQELAGPKGEIWVAAPAFEQSGVSHAISYTGPIQVEKLAERRFAISGTPADCVILALWELMEGRRPDLVISGVNRGRNVSEDAVYSGTLGAALEAALNGVRAIGLSQSFDRQRMKRLGAGGDMYEAARAHGVETVERLLRVGWSDDLFFNVNFPAVGATEVRGARYAQQGRRKRGVFSPDGRTSPGGRRYFWLQHEIDPRSGGPEDDGTLSAEGWITMVPMKPDYTDRETLAALRAGEADAES